jgi:hypothetical protein
MAIKSNALKKKGIFGKALSRTSPIWGIAMSIGFVLLQIIGSRYVTEKKIKMTGSDLKTALKGGLLSHFGLSRKKYF